MRDLSALEFQGVSKYELRTLIGSARHTERLWQDAV